MPHNTFITNAKTRTLKKRLHDLISHSEELKFLVGYFYFSGWKELFQPLQQHDDLTIKILVGLEVDRMVGQSIELATTSHNNTNEEIINHFFESLGHALNNEDMDNEAFYSQIEYFLQAIEEDRLLIRKTLDPNHAKLYLFCLSEEAKKIQPAGLKFITGSSNLTHAGISAQNEFNVEIGDYGTEEAEAYFDDLWDTAVPITEDVQSKKDLLNFLRRKSLAANVTPFEAYTLVLKTYLDLIEQTTVKPQVIRLLEDKGYKKYSYQLDAASQALTIIENYGGVIIADVVGLGKSVIACMIAKHIGKRGMVLAPPGLLGDKNGESGWQKYLHDFALHEWEARSVGDLESVSDYLQDQGSDIEVIIVDEAHRFRNQDTANYELLNSITRNRQVILLSATPFNNSPSDIFSLLKLFLVPGQSGVTLDDDLEAQFSSHDQLFRRLSFIIKHADSSSPDKKQRAENYYQELFGKLPIDIAKVNKRSKLLATKIRSTLEPVLIRRNRIDLINDPVYSNEMKELPTINDPIELFYELTETQSSFYDQVVNEFFNEGGRFTGAIYQPFSYETTIQDDNLDASGNRAFQQQRNLYDFMRRLLVKRFESSFGAFHQSIKNFARVHERVLTFIERSKGRYILDRKLIERIYEGDEEEIDNALAEFSERLASEERPRHDRIYDVNSFEHSKKFIEHINNDLKLMNEIDSQIQTLDLVKDDPKTARIIKELKETLNSTPKDGEPKRKIIIFSEYRDTVKYLKPHLDQAFPSRVLTMDGDLSPKLTKIIAKNFDASHPEETKEDQYDILLATDKISEGFNLNRAGTIINYDIPWNPTRVIQRVGRINRISKTVFSRLNICNFFPTLQGADIIRSREIAAQKMYLIHNTLGEDAKIFDPDEKPNAAKLFQHLNENPEENEEESLLTLIRQRYRKIADDYPEIIQGISQLPGRIKTAKQHDDKQLYVFTRKSAAIFVQCVSDAKNEISDVATPSFIEAIPNIECEFDTPKLSLSKLFWKDYELIKSVKKRRMPPRSDLALETSAINNLQSSLRFYQEELEEFIPFIRTLLEDLRNYKTLPKYSLRRLSCIELIPNLTKEKIDEFKKELKFIRGHLGENYLDLVKTEIEGNTSEIIIAIENIDI